MANNQKSITFKIIDDVGWILFFYRIIIHTIVFIPKVVWPSICITICYVCRHIRNLVSKSLLYMKRYTINIRRIEVRLRIRQMSNYFVGILKNKSMELTFLWREFIYILQHTCALVHVRRCRVVVGVTILKSALTSLFRVYHINYISL